MQRRLSHLACQPGPALSRRLAGALLRWFAVAARDLPWRRTADPYAIWISEIMLQQTQVQTVVPYWERWMMAFPDVARLSAAPIEAVLKQWEGLGYYRRARHLHAAAQQIMNTHHGRFPEDHDAMLALPGIGPYTAGAIGSIAFNQPTAILDGNVIRVLARLFGMEGNPRAHPLNRQLWNAAEGLVRAAEGCKRIASRPCSSLNQALMELGAIICTPVQPQCQACPVRAVCVAQRTGRTEELPHRVKRPLVTQRQFSAFVVWHRGRLLVRQRPGGVVNEGLWEFPNLEEALPLQTPLKRASECLGTPACSAQLLCSIEHSITRFRVRLNVYRVQLAAAKPAVGLAGQWLTLRQIDALALPSAHRKIYTVLLQDQ